MDAELSRRRRTARLAGLQYLALAVAGGFGMLYVPSLLIVPGDTTATANNIVASERLFRLGLVAGILSQVLLLTLALTLHKLLRDIHPQRAALMVAFVAVGVSIACLNMLNPLAALLFLDGAEYLDPLGSQWRHAQAMVCLDLYGQGVVIAEIFWGLWLLPFGALVMKSRFIPRLLGVALVLACFGYLVDCAFQLLVPEVAAIVTPVATTPAAIAEVSMAFWLLIKGVRDVEPERL